MTVSEFHTRVKQNIWKHILSEDNPGDSASRGTNPAVLEAHPLRWNSPNWLKKPTIERPNTKIIEQQMKVELKHVSVHVVTAQNFWKSCLQKFLHSQD